MVNVAARGALFAGAPPFIWFIMRRKSSAESVFLIAMPDSSPGVVSCAMGMCVAAGMLAGEAGAAPAMVSRETLPILGSGAVAAGAAASVAGAAPSVPAP